MTIAKDIKDSWAILGSLCQQGGQLSDVGMAEVRILEHVENLHSMMLRIEPHIEAVIWHAANTPGVKPHTLGQDLRALLSIIKECEMNDKTSDSKKQPKIKTPKQLQAAVVKSGEVLRKSVQEANYLTNKISWHLGDLRRFTSSNDAYKKFTKAADAYAAIRDRAQALIDNLNSLRETTVSELITREQKNEQFRLKLQAEQQKAKALKAAPKKVAKAHTKASEKVEKATKELKAVTKKHPLGLTPSGPVPKLARAQAKMTQAQADLALVQQQINSKLDRKVKSKAGVAQSATRIAVFPFPSGPDLGDA